jgi:RNA polymerase sigma-70 factor (ECF subfamily)
VPRTTGRGKTTGATVSALSDEQLMARICRHDQEAFTCLLSRHLTPIHAYLFRLTGSRADADDLSQETFLRVWRRAASFKPGRVKLATWLHRIAHNLWVDLYRKQRRGVEVALDEVAEPVAEQPYGPAHGETLAHLNTALMALPESQRSALALCQIRGFSNQDAANIMGVGVRALESLLARARKRLKNELSEHTR